MALKTEKTSGSAYSGGVSAGKLAVEFVKPAAAAGTKQLKNTALKAYGRQTKQAQEDKLILEYLPLVHNIVQKTVSYLRPPLSKEDLISAGTIGLVKAARDYDSSRDAEFKTYAYIRVRGAVIDELRGWSFAPTNLKKQFNHAQQLMRQMTEELGQLPTDEQLAQRLGISTEKMYKMFENARARHFLSIHGINEEAPALGSSLTAANVGQPGDRLERQELRDKLAQAIGELPERQRQIILLYYHKELTMKEIALVLEITESRISQLHASALFKLSCKLRQWDASRE